MSEQANGQPVAYICGPYTADTEVGVLNNIALARAVALDLARKGWAVHCPHCNTAGWETRPGIDYELILRMDQTILSRLRSAFDALVRVPGWQKSGGSRREVGWAKAMGLLVYDYPDVPEAG